LQYSIHTLNAVHTSVLAKRSPCNGYIGYSLRKVETKNHLHRKRSEIPEGKNLF